MTNLESQKHALDAQAARTPADADAEYVQAISGQHDDRLKALLARTGLDGQDPITGAEMARRLGVSDQRASQITGRLWYYRDRCRPPAGIWMPQVTVAERDGWPDGHTGMGMEATRGFFVQPLAPVGGAGEEPGRP